MTRSAHQIRISAAMKLHWKGRKREHPERDLQIAVATYLAVALKPPTIWTAFPAGGGGKVRGAQLKAMGLMPGWPDILIMHPEGTDTCVLGLELKSKVGRLSEDQKAMRDSFTQAGGVYLIARDVDLVRCHLIANGIPVYAKVTT